MKKIIIIILSVVCSTYGQDLFNKYKNLIPPKVWAGKQNRIDLDNMFHSFSDYNPAFIYNCIEYLKLLPESTEDAAKAKLYLDYQKNEFCKKLNSWRSIENRKLSDFSKSTAQWFYIWTYLYSLDESPDGDIDYTEQNYATNDTLRNFIINSFYQKESQTYNSETNYKEELNKTLNALTSELNYVYENTTIFPDEKLEYYLGVGKKNPFLFKGTIFDFVENPVPVHLTEFIVKLTDNFVRQKNILSVGLKLDFLFYKDESFYYADSMGLLTSPVFEKNPGAIPYLVIGGSLKLREYKDYLSCINFTAGLGYMESELRSFQLKPIGNSYYMIYSQGSEMRIDPNYAISNAKNSLISFYLRMTTPVFHITPDLFFEAGAFLRSNKNAYSLNLKRNDEFFTDDPLFDPYPLVKYDKEMVFSRITSKVYPVLTLNYSFAKNKTACFSFSYESYFPQFDFVLKTEF